MSADTPTIEPGIVTAGDTWKWKIQLADYLPADGWTLTYSLVNSSEQITLTGSDNGDGYHLISVAAATTAAYPAGDYKWQAYVTGGSSERYTVRRGTITVRTDFAEAGTGFDGRGTWAELLDNLESAFLGMTAGEIKTATISHNGRTLTYRSLSEIREAISFAKSQAYAEEQAEKLANGLQTGNRIRMRF